MTKQEDFWKGQFGREYTDRNSRSQQEWDAFYLNTWGLTKLEMNERCFGHLPRNIRILEVGCNTGMQLVGLQRMGFTDLWGIELQEYAAEEAKRFTKGINIVSGSGFDLPFKNSYFDLVLTNGVLIHIAPQDLALIMSEMVRVSSQYVAGFEYFSEEMVEISYRGKDGYLWKADYGKLFASAHDMALTHFERYPYIESDNIDAMYLLEKQ